MYCVIMGDIIRSRDLDINTRFRVLDELEKELEIINYKYEDAIMANFGFVRGDSFEGVLFSQEYSPEIIQELIRIFYTNYQIKLRISSVSGKLVSISSDRNKSDGPAFYQAVEEIEKLKKKKSDHWFQVSFVTNTDAQPLIDSIMLLLSSITAEWTAKQREIVWKMITRNNMQNLVSEELGMAQSVVSRQLRAANYDVYKASWDNLKEYIVSFEEQLTKNEDRSLGYTVYYSIGIRKNKQKEYQTGEQYLNKALAIAEKEFGKDDARLVPIWIALSEAYIEQVSLGHFDRDKNSELLISAEKAIDSAYRCQKDSPINTIEFLQTKNAEGNLLMEKKEWSKALACYFKVKSIIEMIYGKDSPMLIGCKMNIANAYSEKGEYTKARDFYKESIEQALKTKTYSHEQLGSILYNVANLYLNTSKNKENIRNAIGMFEQSKQEYRRVLSGKNKMIVSIDKKIKELNEELNKEE